MGIFFHALAMVLFSVFALFKVIDLSKITVLEYMVIGIVLMHVPTIYFYLSRRGSRLSESEEKAFEIIRMAKAAGMPAAKTQKMYLDLCEAVLRKVTLNESTQREIQTELNETKQEQVDEPSARRRARN